jgi:DNA invertase Pin-like site-specific DNA recombinase
MAQKKAKAVHTGPKRVALYLRVSSQEQALHGTSLQSQREDLTAHAQERGWEIVGVWEEAGVSGWKGESDRPALQSLMQAARGGEFDCLLVDKWDRFARNLNEQTTMWATLDTLGLEYHSRCEPSTSGREGRFERHIRAVIAEEERDRIRARTTGGRVARLKTGGWGGGDAPLGFRVERDSEGRNAHLVLHEREAAMIRRAVSLLLDQGLTTGEAAAALNGEGFTPRKAPRWTAALLRTHLTRGPWGGVWVYAKEASRRKGRDLLPEPLSVAVPPMLDPDRHAALLTYLRATTSPKTKVNIHPLTGLLVGECGHTFSGVSRRDRGRRRYRCGMSKETGRDWRCDHPTILADALDDAVWAEVLKVLRDPSRLKAAAADYLGVLADSAEAEADALVKADAEVLKVETALSGAFSAGLKAGLDSGTLDQVVADLKRDLAEARTRAQAIRAMQEQTGAQAAGLAQVQALMLDVDNLLENADAALRSEVFRALGVEVRVPVLGPEGEPLAVQVNGADVLGVLGVFAGQSTCDQDSGVLSLAKRTSR